MLMYGKTNTILKNKNKKRKRKLSPKKKKKKRILECIAISSSRASSPPGDRTCVFCGIAGGFFTTEPQGTPQSTGNSRQTKGTYS